MLEEIKALKVLFKENKLKIAIVLVASVFLGMFYALNYNPKFVAEFEMAPYYEISSDLGIELKKISEAINRKDSNFVKVKLSEPELEFNLISNSTYSKINKRPDYSFKHKNLKLVFELKDTSTTKMTNWTKALSSFCDIYVIDSLRSYRGVSVYKEKLKILSENKSLKIENDSLFDFYKSDYLNQNIVLSNAVVNQIVYAQTLGEYKSICKNNYYSKFEDSMHVEQREYSKIEIFTLISIVPLFVFIIITRALKHDNQ